MIVIIAAMSSCTNDHASKEDAAARARLYRIDSLLASRNDSIKTEIQKSISTATDSMTREEYLSRLAKYYCLSATPDSLLPINAEVESFAKKKTNEERGRQLLAFALNTQAAYYHAFHANTDKQIVLYQKAYDLLMSSEDKKEAHKVIANLGDAYAVDNNLPKAAWCYRRALFLVDSLHLPDKENLTLYMGLASIYQQLGDNDNALSYFQKTEKHIKDMSVNMQAYLLNNFGNYYYYAKSYAQALRKFLDMRKLLEDNGMDKNFDMYLCKVNLADVYLNLDSLEKAAKCLDDVEPYVQSKGDAMTQYYCNTIRIGIAVKKHQWAEVAKLENKDEDEGMPFQMRMIRSRYTRQYYVATGNYKQAYNDLKADVTYDDSLEHNRTGMRTADIMARFTADTLRLHRDVALSQQQAKLQKSSIAIIISITIVIILVLTLLLLSQYSRKKMAESKMNIMDLKLSSARNRISPHFIFNVLNNHIIATEGNEKEQLLDMSKLIRQNLDMSRQMTVSLADELKFVKEYIEVEKYTITDKFEYNIYVDDDTNPKEVIIPSMMIQIMVENALVHGLSGWKGDKKLTINVTQSRGGTRIDVIDNGKGFDPRSLHNRMRTGLNIIRQTIAVVNSRNRQKLMFNMSNVTEGDKILGCCASLIIPDKIKI